MEPTTRPGGGGQLDRDNPWPGLESYEEASAEFYIGRAAEADDLQRRIVDEPMTVLFGKSGLGKTSLLKAGVFPRLREQGLLPIFLRLQIRPGTEPLIEQVRLALFGALGAEEIEHPASADGETPWEYLHRIGQELWTRQNRLVRPVFVFDQFEELFTLGRMVPAEVAAFREDLADLVENRIPAGVAHRLENRPASELGLDLQAMPYKVVMALREDFLADLEGWRPTIPSLRRNRMRLLPMGPEQALQAVCNERTKHLVAEPLAREIVAFLAPGAATPEGDGSPEGGGPTVEPALLSLFCRGVNEHRKQEGKDRFDEALVEGGKGTIVTDFYRTSLRDQPERVRRFIEEDLITEYGFRNSYSVDDALAHGFVTSKELEALIDRHLLRHEHHLGTERVELTHDLLTKAVIDERDQRRRAERSELERQRRLRLRRIVGATVIVAAVVVLGFAWAAYEANEARDRSRSKELAALAEAELNENPERAVLLALAGLQKVHTKEARNQLLAAAQYAWPSADLEAKALGGTPEAVALSADGSRLAALAGSGEESAAGGDGARTEPMPCPDMPAPREESAAGGNRVLTLWDVTLRKPCRVWRKEVTASPRLAFSPDQKLLAVVGNACDAKTGKVVKPVPLTVVASIDLRDTKTGDVVKCVPLAEGVGAIAFSPDGRWLAWAEDNKIQLLDYRREDAKAESGPAASSVGAFAVVADGDRIITVTNYTLMAHAFDRQGDGSSWKPTELALGECMKPQSVSPGAEYVSATWRAKACKSRAMDKDATEFYLRGDTFEPTGATWDIVWSAAGHAFAEILQSRDIIVGRSDRFETQSGSLIKGAKLWEADDRSSLISMSEAGTRVALIDLDQVVRIYSLADHKALLSRFYTGPVAVAPDGSWIAVARRPVSDKQTWAVDVIPIDLAFKSDFHSRVRKRIPMEKPSTQITQIYAAQNSVVAVLQTEEIRDGEIRQATTTVVFDATTGKPLFDPLEGQAEALGAARELLLIDRQRVVKTRGDGSEFAPWGDLSAADDQPVVLLVSPGKQALAVLRGQAGNAMEKNAIVYSVREDGLVLAGQVIGVPPELLVDSSPLELADDARSITETRWGDKGPGKFVWRVTSERGAASARQAPAVETPVVHASPSGRFELREESEAGAEESEAGAGDRTFTVVRCADGSTLKTFKGATPRHRFSSDDRWLATWDEKGVKVLDLARCETAWELTPGGVENVNVENVDFEAGNAILNVDLSDDTTTLVPLDRALMERFATWLVPRRLTSEECRRYGLQSVEKCR